MLRLNTNAVFFVLLIGTLSTIADTHYVSTNSTPQAPYTSWSSATDNINDAITAAENGDEIRVDDGVYSVPSGNGLEWDGNIKHLTIQSHNGPENCIIDCDKRGRGFTLNNGQNTNDIIRGFTIINGQPAFQNFEGGGAILVDGTSPIIEGNIMKDCLSAYPGYAADGGAINIKNSGNPTIKENIIKDNNAAHTGGGIHIDWSNATIIRNLIKNNHNGGCYGGGGISLLGNSTADIIDNIIVNNTAHYYTIKGGFGAGIEYMNSGGLLANNIIAYNSTVMSPELLGEGGGVRVRGSPKPSIINNIIYGNISTNGLEDLDHQYPDLELDVQYNNIGSGLEDVKITSNPESNISQDPLFANTNTFYLLDNSPCIDAGANIADAVVDYSGIPRPLDGNNNGLAVTDMGAYEYVHSLSDTDQDGLADSNEVHIVGTDPIDSDSDDDGQTDGSEFIAGTSPMAAGSMFQVESVVTETNTAEPVILWQSVSNRTYSVFSHTNLSTPWPPPLYQIQGDGTQKSYTNDQPGFPRYFRLGVELNP